MNKKKVTKKRVQKPKQDEMVPIIMESLDRSNKMLKTRFKVKNINYIVDNGVIKKGWLISKERDIDDALKLLEVQNAPIYILGEFNSAVFAWEATHSTVVGSLWQHGKKIDEVRSIDFASELKLTMQDWFDKTTKGE